MNQKMAIFQSSLPSGLLGNRRMSNFEPDVDNNNMMMSGINTQPHQHLDGCPQNQMLMRHPTQIMYPHHSQEANVGFDGELNFEDNNMENQEEIEEEEDVELMENFDEINQRDHPIDQILPHEYQASPSSPSGGLINLVDNNAGGGSSGSQDEMQIDEDESSR